MLYIISGVPRSGKSKLARKLYEDYKIPGVNGDILRDQLTIAYPQLGLELDMRDRDRTPILWPYFKGLIEEFRKYNGNYIFESTNFNPDSFKELDLTGISVCFMGFKDVDTAVKLQEIRDNPSEDEWTDDVPDSTLTEWIESWKRRSLVLESECNTYGLNYFDTSKDFTNTIEGIAKRLVL